MVWLLVAIYTLGCIVLGPVFGQSERTREGVKDAMIATALWPLILILGAVVPALFKRK